MVISLYTLNSLPFSFSSLEPFIDTHTLGLHYFKHQLSYLNNLNKIIDKYKINYKLEDIYNHLDIFNEEDINDIIFYLGGVVNHNLYFESINPKNKEIPKDNLLDSINKVFGSLDKFWEKFKNLSLDLKGSGYVFLVIDKTGEVNLITTCNQDSPYLYGYMPLLTIDLWEHAYYVNYENDKSKYFDNFKSIVNFRYANKIFNTKN